MAQATDIDPGDVVTTAEAAEILGVHRTYVLRLARRGDLVPARRLPGKTGTTLYRRADVAALAEERRP